MSKLEQRIALEKRIARKVVKGLLAAGYGVGVDNDAIDYDEPLTVDNSTDFAEIAKEMGQCDEERIYAYKDGIQVGWVYLVYGNDGWDLVNDYTTNLDHVMDSINAYIETLY